MVLVLGGASALASSAPQNRTPLPVRPPVPQQDSSDDDDDDEDDDDSDDSEVSLSRRAPLRLCAPPLRLPAPTNRTCPHKHRAARACPAQQAPAPRHMATTPQHRLRHALPPGSRHCLWQLPSPPRQLAPDAAKGLPAALHRPPRCLPTRPQDEEPAPKAAAKKADSDDDDDDDDDDSDDDEDDSEEEAKPAAKAANGKVGGWGAGQSRWGLFLQLQPRLPAGRCPP